MTARDDGRAAAQALLRTDPLSTDSINVIADAVMDAYAPGHRVEALAETAVRADERGAVLRIVSDWCIEANEVGGVDAGDLAWRLEEAGFPLPDEDGDPS